MNLGRKMKKVLCMILMVSLISSPYMVKAAMESVTATTTKKEDTNIEENQTTVSTTEGTTEERTEVTTAGTTEEKTETTEQRTEGTHTSTTAHKDTVHKRPQKTEKIEVEDVVKKLPDKAEKEETVHVKIIPKIYSDHSLQMKKNKEMIHGFCYFNQGDAAWNDNGYQIRRAGCGPTSMAVVISSLTGRWVTPLDNTVWAYKHGYYSSAGSSHGLIPALAKYYGLNCKGVGTDIRQIREALKKGNPVVCLMGPGYFTKGGHFMVLVGIDEKDHVTVADVGSRQRSRYKYALKDIIGQSKSATAGGPFWIISKKEDSVKTVKKVPQKQQNELEYAVMDHVTDQKVQKELQNGTKIMAMTDQTLIKGEEFIYLIAVDKEGYVTVTDADFCQIKQYPMQEILSHVTSDVTKLSFWKVINK